ncbi:MAG: Lrp/AsnC family transcriptional regulator [Gammaproteobacteria bacterium]|uniref:Lrp/AsnC family transcriptional regulator n=1 Tax=Pseudomaricurvus alcaniphilus TaxID=1166482 RepID=UPI001408645C|nr:Lrp/AsnC family transcriptional regulator [Pseudomaricurvus alcaniphilus]MBR9912897.1 Lrp/AsnC family transcriptional regulator [Gammaproteobacteria bacterium]NHN38695.1 Lrp/AsnC family transcriptional regulator [Pseudomaricurvus alcaniphilus]
MQTNLSATDLKILKQLQSDASLTAAELASRVGLSQSPCWRRVNKLLEEGYIQKRVALLNAEKLGMDVVVFCSVNLSAHGRQSLEEFEQAVAQLPEVIECYTMTGTMDYMLKIVTRDIRHYEKFVRTFLAQMPGIQEIHSNIAVTAIKNTTALPLDTQL